MRMTALDVQNHTFPRRFKGYDVDEVEQFRAALVEDWAELTREADALRRRVAELEGRVGELHTHESTLRNALVTAQGMSDDLRRTAEHEAQMRVGQAELQAEKILAAAHRRATRLAQDVRELRSLRSQLAGSVRATIETHLALLEGFSQDPDDEAEAALEARLTALAGRAEPGTSDAGPGTSDAGPGTSDAEPADVSPAREADAAPRPAAEAAARSEDPVGLAAEGAAAPDADPGRADAPTPLDSLVVPAGTAPATARPSTGPGSGEPRPPSRAWTILPGQG